MTSFDWEILAGGLAAGLGVSFVAVTALRRRGARLHAELVEVNPGRTRRRIDVVALDEVDDRSLERQRKP